ncbi:MAG: metallophosphoesterase [Spirochaetaceae bacterium]|nr:metallophosphoesterase [Spirochaetaceae bacterium]
MKITRIRLDSEQLPLSFDGFTVMFISDFQFDTRKKFNSKMMEKVISKANEQNADLLILGGDYINRELFREEFFALLETLYIPPSGGYAVQGNHDYLNAAATVTRLEELGYSVLQNGHGEVQKEEGDAIHIAGVTDLWFGKPDFSAALEGLTEEDFTIFITHNPDFFIDATDMEEKKLTDIAFAGHTHAGLVTFFGLFGVSPISPKNNLTYRYGLKSAGGVPLYITSGVGGSAFGQFIRFFARPEIVLLELKQIGSD